MKKLKPQLIEMFKSTIALTVVSLVIFLYAFPSIIVARLAPITPDEFKVYCGVIYFITIGYFNYKLFQKLLPYEGKILIYGNPGLMLAIRIIVIIFIIILYYAFVYYMYYTIDKKNFVCNTTDNVQGAEFVYFSIVTFATVGYGDIYPNATSPRMVVSAEIINSIIILIFIVSGIDSLKTKFARFDHDEKNEAPKK